MLLKDKEIISRPIVHIALDEKHIDAAYEIYEEAFPGKNSFFIIKNDRNEMIEYVDNKKSYHFVYRSEDMINELVQQANSSSIIVTHCMTPEMAKIILKLPTTVKKVWSVFGYEVHSNIFIERPNVHGDKTYRTFFNYKKKIRAILQKFYHKYLKGAKSEALQSKKAMFEVDYVSTLIDEEYEYYKKLGLLNRNSEIINFTYYPIDRIIDRNQNYIKGRNILLGNSASYANNHLEAFDFLKDIRIGNRKVITPLSYGLEDYAKVIIKKGKKILGSSFEPLTEFLPLAQYQNILQTCDIVIMNHYRQQAVGNILNSLFMGAKVYLSEKSTVYHYLKRIGCYVYSIENNLKKKSEPLNSLSVEKQKKNREILQKKLSLEMICIELQEKLGPHVQ